MTRATADAKTEQSTLRIREMTQQDYPEVAAILQTGLDSGLATYEKQAPEWDSFMEHRIPSLAFVAEEDTADGWEILGWITASPVSHRPVFHGVIEDSVYVSAAAAGKGVAGALLDRLMHVAGEHGYWKMHSSIFPENEKSIKLHASRGFVHAGTMRAMAKMTFGPYKDQWRDAYTMEKILEHGPAWNELEDPELVTQ